MSSAVPSAREFGKRLIAVAYGAAGKEPPREPKDNILNPRSWAAAGYCPTGQPYQLPLLKTHASRNQAALSAWVPSYALSQMPIHYQANKAVTCAGHIHQARGALYPVNNINTGRGQNTGPAPRLKSNLCNAEDNDTGTVAIPSPSPPPHTHTH
jgi:hypothetical protein